MPSVSIARLSCFNILRRHFAVCSPPEGIDRFQRRHLEKAGTEEPREEASYAFDVCFSTSLKQVCLTRKTTDLCGRSARCHMTGSCAGQERRMPKVTRSLLCSVPLIELLSAEQQALRLNAFSIEVKIGVVPVQNSPSCAYSRHGVQK